MWAHDPRSAQDGSTSSEKCTPASMIKKRYVTDTGPNRPFRCLDCWRSVGNVSSEKKDGKKKISILKSSHIIGFILSLFFGNYIINEIKKAKGKLCWERENICAKVCQHLAFGGLETTLSKFEHRLLATTDTKNPRSETKIWIFPKIGIKYQH